MSIDHWEEWMDEELVTAKKTPAGVAYTVHVTFRDPAWDEKKGLDIPVHADNKRQAIKFARRIVSDAGHLGVLYFKATEMEAP